MTSIVYFTKTHNTERFVNKVIKLKQYEVHQITKENKATLVVNQPFVLLTPTFGFGKAPEEVMVFLENNKENMRGVMSSGNRNWGGNFANSGNIISDQFNTYLIGKYELAGMKSDVDKLINYMERLNE